MPSPPAPDTLLPTLLAHNITLPPGRIRVDAYGDSPEMSEKLIGQIRDGRKRAGTSLVWAMEYDGDSMPECGDIEIVVDHRGEPALVVRITSVAIVPFDEVTDDYAAIEGEGDGSLDFWRTGHWNFFARECARIGRVPVANMPVVCSAFEVVAVVPKATSNGAMPG